MKVIVFLKEHTEKKYFYKNIEVFSINKKIELEAFTEEEIYKNSNIEKNEVLFIQIDNKIKEERNTNLKSLTNWRTCLNVWGSIGTKHPGIAEIAETRYRSNITFKQIKPSWGDGTTWLNGFAGSPFSSSKWTSGTYYSNEIHFLSGCNRRPIYVMWEADYIFETDGSRPDPGIPREPSWNYSNKAWLTDTRGIWLTFNQWDITDYSYDYSKGWDIWRTGTAFLQYWYDGYNFYLRNGWTWNFRHGHSSCKARVRYKAIKGGYN